MRRVIARGGRGRAHLGGGLATAADLAATVAGLIDIASQHDQQSLTDPESQLAILDAFAENQALRDEMAAAYAARAEARAALARFAADARARGRARGPAAVPAGELEAAAAGARRGRARWRRAGAPQGGGEVPGGDRARRGDAVRGGRRRRRAPGRRGARAGAAGGARSGAGAARRAAAPRRRPRSRTSRAISAATRGESGRTRRGSAEVEERLFLLSRLCRKHGGTADGSRGQADRRCAPSWPSSARSRRGWPRGRRRVAAAEARAPRRRRRRCRRRGGGRPAASRRRSAPCCASWRSPRRGYPSAIEARDELGPNGAERVRLPVRAQPRRGAAAAGARSPRAASCRG